MFVQLLKKQQGREYAQTSNEAAKRSWRRQRRVQKIMARTIV